MLVLRTAIRSRLGLNVMPAPVRWYRPTPRLLYRPLVEPYTWRARMWYRPDGTPRSKWKAATAFSIFVLINSLQEAVDEIYLLSLLVQVQRVDAKYPLYDLSKSSDVLSYFSDIVHCLPNEVRQEEIGIFLQGVEHLMEITPELPGLLRTELEKIHKVLTQDPAQDPLDTAEAVMVALRDLSSHLVEMWQKAQGVTLGLQEAKDKGPVGDDTYEVVG
ncbi:hypothetical protein AN958_10615 [Leucoagaricus sp. SymC.cos]|nr:hypothetical protein AN958_10615 [Leucoagaricus sp. SymC.cos]